MSTPRHTLLLGRVLSGVHPAKILSSPRRSPNPARCARPPAGPRTTSAADWSRAYSRGRRSAAMADDADAMPHSDSADHVPNGGMPNGGAVPERDGTAAVTPSDSGAHILSSTDRILCALSGTPCKCPSYPRRNAVPA